MLFSETRGWVTSGELTLFSALLEVRSHLRPPVGLATAGRRVHVMLTGSG